MNNIRFSKDYPKLQGMRNAKLMQIFKVRFRELDPTLLSYDAKQSDGNYYQFNIKQDEYVLVLVFGEPGSYRMFTTVRRWTQSKEDYYHRNIGTVFEIVRG